VARRLRHRLKVDHFEKEADLATEADLVVQLTSVAVLNCKVEICSAELKKRQTARERRGKLEVLRIEWKAPKVLQQH
jgi:hypothetical protein